jgi:hypothetical protein
MVHSKKNWEEKIMKKWTVWMMALTFTLAITSLVFAQAAKDPIPGLGAGEKEQIEMSKKKATEPKKTDKMATKPGDVPGLGAGEKEQIEMSKKKATTKKKADKKSKKASDVPGLGAGEKEQIEMSKKPGSADKPKAAPAAPAAAPAEKK